MMMMIIIIIIIIIIITELGLEIFAVQTLYDLCSEVRATPVFLSNIF
jgi:hypothetical protein